jgi:hypothetical protein
MKTILETDKDFICDINAPCFRNLLPEEAQLVSSSKTQVFFRKDDNLTKQGAFASYVLFVINGLAKQYLSAVFFGNIFNYSSIALTDCQVFLIEKETMAKVIRQNGSFGFSITKRYCEQNANLLDTVRNLMYKQMNGRLADALLYIDSLRSEAEEIFQLLSRKDIANFAGISTESAVKLLKTFEKEGLIELHEKDIKLVNHDAMFEISRRG